VALTADDLAVLLESFKSSEWTELALSLDGIRLELTKPDAQKAPPPQPVAQAEAAPAFHTVTSPSIGIFHPTAQPGDTVESEDVLGTLQVLKVTMDVKAGARGTVQSVHATDGGMVEHGQPLFTVEP
jgi:acetyl-CoA carboxylase biotin carboxyl carrier protein